MFRALVEAGLVEDGPARVREGYAAGFADGCSQGRLLQAHRTVLTLGAEKFGPPDLATVLAVNALCELATLDMFIRRVLKASSWQELLASVSDR